MFVNIQECKKSAECGYPSGIASVGNIPVSGSFEELVNCFQGYVGKCRYALSCCKVKKETNITLVCGDTIV